MSTRGDMDTEFERARILVFKIDLCIQIHTVITAFLHPLLCILVNKQRTFLTFQDFTAIRLLAQAKEREMIPFSLENIAIKIPKKRKE